MADDISNIDDEDLEGSTDLESDLGQEDMESGYDDSLKSGWISMDFEDLGKEVLQDYEFDFQANTQRFTKLKEIMRLVNQDDYLYGEIDGTPSPYIVPLLTASAINFNSIAYPAILNDGQPVKCGFYGKDEGRMVTKLIPAPQTLGGPLVQQQQVLVDVGIKGEMATQYSQFASWQVMHDIKHWKEELDKMLMMIPNIGCLFKKVYPSGLHQNVQSDLILPFQLIVHPSVKNLESAPRISQVIEYYPHECEAFIKSGEWFEDIDIEQFTAEPLDKLLDNRANNNDSVDKDAARIFIEQHRRYDLDNDGYAEPVIVLVEKDSGTVCKVESNFLKSTARRGKDGKIIYAEPIQYFIKFGFFRDPAGSIYDIGFGQIFYEQVNAINSATNMLLDSAHRSNLHTGLIGKGGVRMQGGTLTLKEGSYMFIESYGGNLKDNIVELEAKEPSQTLFALLGFMKDYVEKSTSQSDVMAGQNASNTTATGTLGLIEQGVQQYKAILHRLRDSLDQELNIMLKFNTIAFKKPNPFDMNFEDPIWSSEIFYINPSFDINNLTSSIRLAKIQILIDLFNTGVGQSMNRMEVAKEAIDSLDIEKPQRFLEPNPPTTAEQQLQMGEQQKQMMELKVLYMKEQNRKIELGIKHFEATGKDILNRAKAQKAVNEINPNKDDLAEAKIGLDKADTIKTLAEAHAIINDVGDAREESTITE